MPSAREGPPQPSRPPASGVGGVHSILPRAGRRQPRGGRVVPRAGLPWTFMRQQKSRCDARYVSSMSCLLWFARSAARLAGSERFSHGSHDRADAQLLSGRFPAPMRRIRPPIPLAAGTAFRRRDPSTGRRLSALSMVGHSPPGPAPAASGRTGTVRSQDQASLAPVGTRPVSQNRQRAMSSLRASATTITRRIRPRPPAVRSSNHLLSALSG